METEIMYGALGTIVACVIYVSKVILSYLKKDGIVKGYETYKPYAIMASKWAEKQVPDDYGADSEDPATARAIHKLDVFLKKFNDVVTIQDGVEPSQGLKDEALKWSVELAKQIKK